MRGQLATVALVCATLVAAVALGIAWGLGAAHGVRWVRGRWSLCGCFAVFILAAESLHYLASRPLRTAKPLTPWVCMGLGSYAAWLMSTEAFMWYTGDSFFIMGVLRLLPYLLAVSPLVRTGAWLGVTGSLWFFATSLAILIRNGFSLQGGSGFFGEWVS